MCETFACKRLNEYSIGTLEHHIQQAKAISMWESVNIWTRVWTHLPETDFILLTSVLRHLHVTEYLWNSMCA